MMFVPQNIEFLLFSTISTIITMSC